jgi:hypothetical protein
MTHTITLVADHLGVTAPKVLGHEYYVDMIVNITDYDEGVTTTGNFLSASNQFLRTSGTALPTDLVVGQELAITNAADVANNATVTFVSLDSETITLSAVTDDHTADEITLSQTQELIPLSSIPLSKVTQVQILGQETETLNFHVELGTDGNTVIADNIVLKALTGSSGALATGDVGTVRLRVFGLL